MSPNGGLTKASNFNHVDRRQLSELDNRTIKKIGCVRLCREERDFSRHRRRIRNCSPFRRSITMTSCISSRTITSLLYECLETFAQRFNEQAVGWLSKKSGIQRINFRSLVHLLFWDTSFLADHLAKMNGQETRTMLIWPKSIRLTAGFKTHPDELAFTLCDEALTKDLEQKLDVPAWSASSSSYPSAGR